jgi:CPA1 family monovalent cation:H+ antiporter
MHFLRNGIAGDRHRRQGRAMQTACPPLAVDAGLRQRGRVHGADLVLALLAAVAALVTIARRAGIAYPILLLVGGLVLGLVPGRPEFRLEPDLVFLIVLPPLLYRAAFFTPIRSLRANVEIISGLAVALVVATALAVAWVARAMVPGLPWSVAIVLGAIVAPPDAIAATAVASRLGLPRQVVTILEGESLLNDATALTMYTIALAVAAGAVFSPSGAAITFAGALLGGAVIGVGVGWMVAQIRRRIEDTPVEITISLLTPYAAYLPAERLDASGVIAAVVAGLYLGHRGPGIMGADARLTGRAVWETTTFLLNGFVFVVMGFEVPFLLRAVTLPVALQLVGIGLAVCGVLVVVRVVFIFLAVFVPQLLRRQRDVACSIVLSWAGMRGVVSLAAALALPATLTAGGPVPAREALVIVTVTVIVFTLLGQGLTLPWLIRWLRLGSAVALRQEEAIARQALLEAAGRRIDELYPVWPGHRPLLDQLRAQYQHRSEHVDRQRNPASEDGEDRELIEHREIQRTVIDSEREALMRLRAEGEIGEEVLRELERELDLEERRMDA